MSWIFDGEWSRPVAESRFESIQCVVQSTFGEGAAIVGWRRQSGAGEEQRWTLVGAGAVGEAVRRFLAVVCDVWVYVEKRVW